ncbi:MAG: glycosyltransferase [Dermabacter sp.]|nr:glycosyltransferase [Dermabacter sp.]
MSDRLRLSILSFSPLHRDPRVLRQIRLFAGDYAVTTVGFGPSPDPRVTHVRLPDGARAWPSHKLFLLARAHRRTYGSIPAVSAARAALAGHEADIVLANDVNTLPLAAELAPRLGIHADLHEYSPREKEHDVRWRLVVGPFMRWICRTYLPRVASITTVSPGLAAEYAREFGVRCEVVLNAPARADIAPRPTAEPLRLIHTGVARANRSLEVMIEAVRDLEHLTLDFMLVESEPGVIDDLRRRAEGLEHVRFRAPVPFDEIVPTLATYDASLVFFPPTTFNLRHTLPNKLFEAVQARGALVVSPSPDMADLVREYGIGVVAEGFTPGALAEALSSLSPERVDAYKRASNLAAATLNAETQAHGWVRALDALASGKGPA